MKNAKLSIFEHVDMRHPANIFVKAQDVDSRNGFVREIRFSDGKSALLKCQSGRTADPLIYEYLVGQFVNEKLAPRFPNFIRTYGCYHFVDPVFYAFMRDMSYSESVSPGKFRQSLVPIGAIKSKQISKAICTEDSKYNSLLIEYVNDAVTFESLLVDKAARKDVSVEIVYLLYQIYFALSCVRELFTHYDLHLENVLLQKCPGNGYYEYHYMEENGTERLSFKSRYMAKLIDYGMSFFSYGRGGGDDNNNHNHDKVGSRKLCENLCMDSVCNRNVGKFENTECGGEYGVKYCRDDMRKPKYNDYHISRLRKNESHDLKLAHQLLPRLLNKNSYLQFFRAHVLTRIEYGKGYNDHGGNNHEYAKWRNEYRNKDIADPREFGTVENVAVENKRPIRNVSEMEYALRQFIKAGGGAGQRRGDVGKGWGAKRGDFYISVRTGYVFK